MKKKTYNSTTLFMSLTLYDFKSCKSGSSANKMNYIKCALCRQQAQVPTECYVRPRSILSKKGGNVFFLYAFRYNLNLC